MTSPPTKPAGTSARAKRGFAAMSPEQRQKIASMGGAAVPAEKRSFSQDRTLARAAGTKGGQSVDGADRSFARDRKLASAAGKKGGLAGAKKPKASGKIK
jgi:general stress protein YciG